MMSALFVLHAYIMESLKRKKREKREKRA